MGSRDTNQIIAAHDQIYYVHNNSVPIIVLTLVHLLQFYSLFVLEYIYNL